jgi:hypothetical protein
MLRGFFSKLLVTIRKAKGTKNKVDLTVSSHAGPQLQKLLEYVKDYRARNGFRPLEPTDLVFGNPRRRSRTTTACGPSTGTTFARSLA